MLEIGLDNSSGQGKMYTKTLKEVLEEIGAMWRETDLLMLFRYMFGSRDLESDECYSPVERKCCHLTGLSAMSKHMALGH